MTQITDIFTADPKGLIPYLDLKIESSFDGFQIKPWNFTSNMFADNQDTGYRVSQCPTETTFGDGSPSKLGLQVRVGKVLLIDNQSDAFIQILEIRDRLDYYIREWHDCVNDTVCGQLDEIDGLISKPLQNTSRSSAKAGAWAIAVFRDFRIFYDQNPIDSL